MSLPMRKIEEAAPVQEPVTSPRPRSVRRRGTLRAVLTLTIAVVVCGAAGAGARQIWYAIQPVPTLRTVPVTAQNGAVTPGSTSIERQAGFLTLTGSAVNHTNHNFLHVEAVVELLDAQNQVLKIESAMTAFETLAAHNNAPFQIVSSDDPRVAAYRVHFRELAGASLD